MSVGVDVAGAAIARVKEIAKRRAVDVHSEVVSMSGVLKFYMDGLPILPFFTDLAIALDVPLSNISVEHDQGSDPGCSCGPVPCSFTCAVKLVRELT